MCLHVYNKIILRRTDHVKYMWKCCGGKCVLLLFWAKDASRVIENLASDTRRSLDAFERVGFQDIGRTMIQGILI